MQHAASPSVQLALTLDRGLRLDIEPGLLPLLAGWAPVDMSSAPLVAVPAGAVGAAAPVPTPVPGAGGALVRVVRHRCPRPEAPAREPDVRHGGARCWMDDERGVALVHGAAGGWARVLLAHGEAEVVAPAVEGDDHAAASREAAAADLRAMCTIAVGLLAGRREGVLVAASAVIAPDGGGWLLVGEASSGKSTTAAHLVTAGWGYLADEEVLLHAGNAGSIWLEGWPRALPIDGMWPYGRPMAPRGAGRGIEASGLARARWRRTAPLAGILTTQLAPSLPTLLTRATSEAALASLVRATPWLLADTVSTRYELGLLRSASHAPAWRLRLGRDTQGDVTRLARCMRPLEAAS